MPELLNLNEAARQLGMSARTLRIQATRGALRAIKPGTEWLVTQDEVVRYARENRMRPRAESQAVSDPATGESQPPGES